MKCILRGYGVNMTSQQRNNARTQAKDMTIARGTGKTPLPPTDVFAQAGPRGILVNWRPSSGYIADITGWRVYKGTETALFAEINDPNTQQYFIEATAGSSPPVTNVFVSSVNGLGVESPKRMVQAAASTEAGAPTMPVTPPTYTTPFSGTGTTRGRVPA